jgi:hypothetical protein
MRYPRSLKAITVLQPWATFLAIRAKRNETRSWATKHRGPIAIHAGLKPVSLDDLRQPGILQALRRHCVIPEDMRLELIPDYLPLGQVLCIADLIDCHKTEDLTQEGEIQLTEEFYLGNYAPGRFAFEMEVLDTFDPGIPFRGAQGLWLFTFPDTTTQKEPTMAKTQKEKTEKPAKDKGLDESQALKERGAVDAAFSAPATERPGAPSDPDFDKQPEAAGPTRMPDTPVYTTPVDPSEFLPAFQKIVFIKFSREDLAVRAEQMAACDEDMKQLEMDKAEEVKSWNEKIKIVEGKRTALSSQVTARGEEREVECRKRINEETQEVVIFNAANLEIIEQRKLNKTEMQTEMRILDTQRAAAAAAPKPAKGSKVIDGKFPKDKVIGAGEPANPGLDQKNDAAIKALANSKE